MGYLTVKSAALVLGSLVSLVCCAQSFDPELAERLRSDIDAVGKQIKVSEQENAKYTGGLVKALIGARLAILRQTEAMLEQREKSWTFGIGVNYAVAGKPFVPPTDADEQLAAVASEIETLDEKIKRAEQDAARYAGGLVLAMKRSAIATMSQTRAMLQQKRLSLKYALPQYMPFVKAAESGTQGEPQNKPEAPSKPRIEVVGVEAKVTEKNNTWWKLAWKLTLRNPTEAIMSYRATIEFHDADGFVVDDDTARNLVVAAGQEKVFTGYALVDASVAGNVASAAAKVTLTR